MKRQDDDTYSSIELKFEYYINNPDKIQSYLSDAKDIDIIAFYKYSVRKIEELRNTKPEEIKKYWNIANKLEKTAAMKKYLRGEIKDIDIKTYIDHENELNNQILEAIKKRQHKTFIQRAAKFFKG